MVTLLGLSDLVVLLLEVWSDFHLGAEGLLCASSLPVCFLLTDRPNALFDLSFCRSRTEYASFSAVRSRRTADQSVAERKSSQKIGPVNAMSNEKKWRTSRSRPEELCGAAVLGRAGVTRSSVGYWRSVTYFTVLLATAGMASFGRC